MGQKRMEAIGIIAKVEASPQKNHPLNIKSVLEPNNYKHLTYNDQIKSLVKSKTKSHSKKHFKRLNSMMAKKVKLMLWDPRK